MYIIYKYMIYVCVYMVYIFICIYNCYEKRIHFLTLLP